MLEATPIQAQLADARGDPLRVLVVGAGVAGVTLAQLLRRQGLHPVLVERSAREALATVTDPTERTKLDADAKAEIAAFSAPAAR